MDLGFHFQNCKHFLEYFGFYLLTTVYIKKRFQEFLFICLFAKLQRQKQILVFTNSAVKVQHILFANQPSLPKMLVLLFSSSIPLYIGENPVEKLCKVFEMELKMHTPVGPKFVFDKIKFKFLHYIQHDFIHQRRVLSKDQTSIFKILFINYLSDGIFYLILEGYKMGTITIFNT